MAPLPADKKRIPFFWGWLTLLLAAIVWSISNYLVAPPSNNQTTDALPWNAHMDEANNLSVLGLTLGKSTTRDAMALYGKEIEIKLFTDKENQPVSIESFFEDMYIGYSLRGRLILTLATNADQLQNVFLRGGRVKSSESGAHEITISGADIGNVLDLPIRALTYIPYPKLDEATLTQRFGVPEEDTIGADGLKRWHYPDKQLTIIFDDSGRKTLEFGE